MISEERLEKAITYLAHTDEPAANARTITAVVLVMLDLHSGWVLKVHLDQRQEAQPFWVVATRGIREYRYFKALGARCRRDRLHALHSFSWFRHMHPKPAVGALPGGSDPSELGSPLSHSCDRPPTLGGGEGGGTRMGRHLRALGSKRHAEAFGSYTPTL